MTIRSYLLLMLAMGAVTYLPRMIPLVLLSRQRLPLWFSQWLELIPPAILSALIAPTLLTNASPRSLAVGKMELLAAVPTFYCAVRTRSLAATVLVGMICYGGLQLLR
jgi:branched-subunit amino acid transport protein